MSCIDESERAQEIVLSLMKKLKIKPALFSDVFAALKKSGVEMIQDIKGIDVCKQTSFLGLFEHSCGCSQKGQALFKCGR